MNRNFLNKTQPIFTKIIERSIKENKLSHAFLLVGDNTDIPSMFLSQSIICNKSDLACEECDDCRRIAEGIYPDIIVVDGNESSIKKNDVVNVKNVFSKSSVEGKARIYIFKNVENSSNEAMNRLLKFLEEPEPGIYAIFTTKNINKVLPTIQSRCQVIHLLPNSKETIYNELLLKNVDDEDAHVLSELFGSIEECEMYIQSEEYDDLKLYVFDFIEDIYRHPGNTLINLQIHLLKKYKNKESIRLFLNMLVLGLRDLFHVKHSIDIVYTAHREFFEGFEDDPNIIDKIELILETNYNIDTNINLLLLIDSMVYQL